MDQQPSNQLEWFKNLPGWTKATIGFIGAIIAFIISFRENFHLAVVVVAFLLLATLLYICLYVILSRTPGNQAGAAPEYRFGRLRFWGLGSGLGLLVVLGRAF
ncbi:hypothetical protein RY27_12555, partial [Litorilinea aerophila]